MKWSGKKDKNSAGVRCVGEDLVARPVYRDRYLFNKSVASPITFGQFDLSKAAASLQDSLSRRGDDDDTTTI